MSINKVSGFLPLHIRQRRSNTVQYALDVHIDHSVPVVYLCRRSSGECGISPALLIMTSMRPYVCTAVSTNLLTWSTCVTSVGMASALPSSRVSSSAKDCKRSARRAPSTTVAPRLERYRPGLPSPGAAAAMTTTFPFNVIVHHATTPFYRASIARIETLTPIRSNAT